jgi:dihydrofolate reductase
MSPNGVIGRNGELPWYLPEETAYFNKITEGHPCIMGTRTLADILAINGKPLLNRISCVLTNNPFYLLRYPSVWQLKAAMSLEGALKMFEGKPSVFIIGGGVVFKEALEKGVVDELYITKTHQEFEGDTYFPVDSIQKELYKEVSAITGDKVDHYHYVKV